MTKAQKIKYIVGIVCLVLTSVIVPIVIKSMPEKTIIDTKGGIMIEQKAVFPGGGGGTYTIGKTITVTKKTNGTNN